MTLRRKNADGISLVMCFFFFFVSSSFSHVGGGILGVFCAVGNHRLSCLIPVARFFFLSTSCESGAPTHFSLVRIVAARVLRRTEF